jgi:predicted dehydrogenase
MSIVARRQTNLSVPRVGFLGLGWIGQNRMKAAVEAASLEAVAFVEPSDDMAAKANDLVPQLQRVLQLADMAELEPDGLVIATPSASHAEQSIQALEMGMSVFCQKPLGRTKEEVERVLGAARKADRLLAVDFSYRFTEAARQIREHVASGELGRIYAIDLVFHNAYGPNKPWFYDRALSGGGCVMDLGVHLIDLAVWATGNAETSKIEAQLFAGGERLKGGDVTEDFAFASFRLGEDIAVRLTCSWKVHAGQNAVISASFYGDRGAVEMRNVGGSFYDFVAERFEGTARTLLCEPPDEWGGRAIVDWAQRLERSSAYDPEVEQVAAVAGVIDRIYAAEA